MTTRRNVLITGGSRGIGLFLATRMLARGDRVLVTGRSEASLLAAQAVHPHLEALVADMSTVDGRKALAAHIGAAMPELDLLVQNAGVQRRIGLAADDAAWPERQVEIDTLFAGPVHLDHLLVPVMLAHGRPATIVEVTSGGAVVPQPFAPLYSASKAALHHYTLLLRMALAATPVHVVELMPPAVATGLGGAEHGVPPDEFCDAAVTGIDAGEDVIGFGATAGEEIASLVTAQRRLFEGLSGRFPIASYSSP